MAMITLTPLVLVFTGFGLHTVPMIVLTGATGAALLTGMN